MDPFDEFEFKPLSEGLGFHQKRGAGQTTESSPAPAMTGSKSLGGLEIIDEHANPFRAPLPRKDSARPAPTAKPAPVKDAQTQAVDEILQTLQRTRRLGQEAGRQEKEELRRPVTPTLKTALPSVSSMFLDGLLILAASLLCMIIMLMVTKVDLLANLSNPDQEGLIYASTLALFGGVSFLYMVVNRYFLGYTPGEWASEMRVGTPRETGTVGFALRVAARQLLTMITGFALLPILSLIVRFDIAGRLTGARLYKNA